MNLTDILSQAGGIESMAGELGVSPETAKAGAEALLPAILGGFKKQAQGSGGVEGLGGLLGQLGGGGLLDAVLGPQPTPVDQGNDVLGQIFGSKDVSRTVAGHAAERTGLDSGLLKKMLPILAMLVAGYLAKQGGQQGEGGGLGGLIGGMLGGGGAGGLGGVLGSVLGGGGAGGGAAAPAGGLGGLGQLIDLNGDGNPLDDIIGMAGKLRG
ncbi:MAG TPA: DUF937 domain-containing protein [Sphingomonas sp.]|nr:DUF937 domain-containing protein [Sphingomonas sp.]